MAGIFISYRRSDSAVAAGRLADDLADAFGRDSIFRDVDTITVGEDYERALDRALDSCAVLIAVIGPQWSTMTDESGRRRLEDPRDWIRIEICRALARDMRVIPIVISGAMPRESELPPEMQPLLRRQALELTDRHWRQDLQLLVQALEKVPGIAKNVSTSARATPSALRRIIGPAAAVVVLLTVSGLIGWRLWPGNPSESTLFLQAIVFDAQGNLLGDKVKDLQQRCWPVAGVRSTTPFTAFMNDPEFETQRAKVVECAKDTQTRKVAINRYVRERAAANDKQKLDAIATLLQIPVVPDLMDERNSILLEMDKRVVDEESMDTLSNLLRPVTELDF